MFKKPVSYGRIETGVTSVAKGWTLMDQSHPYSAHYSPAVGDTPKEIVAYLLAQQIKYLHGTILGGAFTTIMLQHQVKVLFNKSYTPLEIKRGIALGALYANNPFTFSFVEKMIVQWRNGEIGVGD